ncbi:ABC transporter ATP-binding protein [Clostridium kluyveri]|nr:ABC transporter ATP-binding protein [Clostridium kluyveri]
MIVIECNKLTKTYKKGMTALKDITLKINSGSITGFAGENGSGKSTTINILTSLITKSSGYVEIFGKELNEKNCNDIKRKIGFVGEQIVAFQHLNVIDYWNFIGRIFKLKKSDIYNRIDELLDILDLQKDKNKIMRKFSKGMKQKALLGGALIHSPQLLILDEPLDGIDLPSRIVIKNILKQMNSNGVTIFISSHDFSLIEDICTDVVVINEGTIKFNDTVDELYNQYKNLSLEQIFIKLINKEDKLNKKLSW